MQRQGSTGNGFAVVCDLTFCWPGRVFIPLSPLERFILPHLTPAPSPAMA